MRWVFIVASGVINLLEFRCACQEPRRIEFVGTSTLPDEILPARHFFSLSFWIKFYLNKKLQLIKKGEFYNCILENCGVEFRIRKISSFPKDRRRTLTP